MNMAKKKNTKATGRPPKITFEEKARVIDSYLVYKGGGNPLSLSGRGIFTNLAEYAKTLTWIPNSDKLLPHDFARDQRVREYIDNLILTVRHNENSACVKVYVPANFVEMEKMSRSEIISVFKKTELVNEERYKVLTETLEANDRLRIDNACLLELLNASEEKLKGINVQIDERDEKIARISETLKDIIKSIRNVRTQLAAEYFEKLPKRGLPSNVIALKAQEIVGCPIGVEDDNNEDDDIDVLTWKYEG